MDELRQKAAETVKKYNLIPAGSRVCAAVSGGADSMALLCFLIELRGELDIELSAVNIEHGIRGKESIRDSEFVKDFCDKAGIPLKIFMVNTLKHAENTKQSAEAAARELRYKSFESLRGRVDRVALAHHRGDQAETVLLRLFRGSGAGLSGMEYIRDGFYIRPFLSVSRAEVMGYVSANKIPFVNDATNSDNAYDRNFVRNIVMPKVAERWQGAETAIARAAQNIAADNDYINGMMPEVTFEDGEALIETDKFSLHGAILNRLIFKALEKIGVEKDIEARHIGLIKELLKSGPTGAAVMLPQGAEAVKDYDGIAFTRHAGQNAPAYGGDFFAALEKGGFDAGNYALTFDIVSQKEYNETVRAKALNKDGINYFDAALIGDGAVIRPRMNGDVFTKFGGGTLPLSDYFIDKKIPARHRGRYPVIADGNRILCVCGVEISDGIRVGKKPVKIVRVTLVKKEQQSER